MNIRFQECGPNRLAVEGGLVSRRSTATPSPSPPVAVHVTTPATAPTSCRRFLILSVSLRFFSLLLHLPLFARAWTHSRGAPSLRARPGFSTQPAATANYEIPFGAPEHILQSERSTFNPLPPPPLQAQPLNPTFFSKKNKSLRIHLLKLTALYGIRGAKKTELHKLRYYSLHKH